MNEFTLEPTPEQMKEALFRCLQFLETGVFDDIEADDLTSEIKAALFDPNQPGALLTADELEQITSDAINSSSR